MDFNIIITRKFMQVNEVHSFVRNYPMNVRNLYTKRIIGLRNCGFLGKITACGREDYSCIYHLNMEFQV